MGYFFRKRQRVVHSEDFTRALRKGQCAADATLVLFALPQPGLQIARLGVTIPKKNKELRHKLKACIQNLRKKVEVKLACQSLWRGIGFAKYCG